MSTLLATATFPVTKDEKVSFSDLSDFIVTSFSCGERELHFHVPLILSPQLTESRQFMTLQNSNLGIDVIAETREELWDELLAELRMLWNYCAVQPDETLGKQFRQQKKNLLAAIKEGTNGNS
jgi:hypothetical protein